MLLSRTKQDERCAPQPCFHCEVAIHDNPAVLVSSTGHLQDFPGIVFVLILCFRFKPQILFDGNKLGRGHGKSHGERF